MFIIVNITKIIAWIPPSNISKYKCNGIGGYFKGYLEPVSFILPITILERVMLPISLSLRLFGNMLAATFIIELVYESLEKIAWFAQLVIPIPLHF